ncbi:MAG TPA: nuclear transport factor 2 family protein [Caulobacteraceae bacterium]|jgi:ketosteroid isomerase-like protein|nr:nuclear transport factor 2 family protein [Caulobacteraceae bacterium]
MRTFILALLAAISLAQSAQASDRSDIIALVQAFNRAQTTDAYQALCADDAIVIDHAPPFMFRGPRACAAAWEADLAWAAKDGLSLDRLVQKLAAPTFVRIDGDQAYAVFAGKAWFDAGRRREVEGLYATFVLRRQAGAWRIAAVTWSSLGWRAISRPRR